MLINKRPTRVITLADVHQVSGSKRTATLRHAKTPTETYLEIQAGTVVLTCGPISDGALSRMTRCLFDDLWRLTGCKECDVEPRIRQLLDGLR